MTVGIYIRVSTAEQAKEGYSIPAQKERLAAYCVAQGWDDYKFYIDDGVSARDMDRPKLQLLLDHVKQNKIRIILVYRLDRFTRSVRDLHKMLEMLNEYSCGFKSATEVFDTTTATGRLFISIVASLAEWESDNMSERIKMALEEKASSGERVGNIPYPFDLGKDEKLVANPRRARITLDIINKIESGWSASRVADYLTKTNSDKPKWFANTVLRILENPAIYGATSWVDRVFENTHEGIISKERFDKLQDILKSRAQHRLRHVKSTYLFQGVLTCPTCQKTMSVNRYIRKRKDGTTHQSALYKCQICWKEKRKSPYVGEQRILEALYAYMKDITFEEVEPEPEPEEPDHILTDQLQQIEKKREKYQRAWASDLMTDEEFEKLMDETKEIYGDLKQKISEQEKPAKLDIKHIKNIATNFNENFQLLTQDEKRTFIATFIKRIDFKLVPRQPKRPDKSKVGKPLIAINDVLFY